MLTASGALRRPYAAILVAAGPSLAQGQAAHAIPAPPADLLGP